MRLFWLLVLVTFGIVPSRAQVQCGAIAAPMDWNFEENIGPWLHIDTLVNPDNVWQVGKPQKNAIDSAHSPTNAIVTDTLNPYPPNDTSFFIFEQVDHGGYSYHHSAEFAGYYNVDSDSLNDYGMMEISFDHGATWVNILTDTVYDPYIQWFTPKPVLTGNSNGWVNFWVGLANLPFNIDYGDTVLLKFSFISDSIADGLDGLAFDNFNFCNGVENVREILGNDIIDVYPNPAVDLLVVNRNTQSQFEAVKLFNCTGQLVYEDSRFTESSIDFESLNLTSGMYFLKYSNHRHVAIKKVSVKK